MASDRLCQGGSRSLMRFPDLHLNVCRLNQRGRSRCSAISPSAAADTPFASSGAAGAGPGSAPPVRKDSDHSLRTVSNA